MKHTKINIKKLLLIILILFCFNSLTKADDIKDFQIESMSIGDSLLDFFSKREINNFKNYDNLPSDMKFRIVEFGETSNFKIKNYDVMQVYYKPNDNKFIIFGVRAALYCDNKKECKNQQNKIINDLKQNFNYSFTKEKFKHPDDKSGKSFVEVRFLSLNKGYMTVRYTNWDASMPYDDNVDVEIGTKEVEDWVRSNYGTAN